MVLRFAPVLASSLFLLATSCKPRTYADGSAAQSGFVPRLNAASSCECEISGITIVFNNRPQRCQSYVFRVPLNETTTANDMKVCDGGDPFASDDQGGSANLKDAFRDAISNKLAKLDNDVRFAEACGLTVYDSVAFNRDSALKGLSCTVRRAAQ